jgi:hypothetical protein
MMEETDNLPFGNGKEEQAKRHGLHIDVQKENDQ